MAKMNSIYLNTICGATRFVAVGLAISAGLLQAASNQRTFGTPMEAIQATIDAAEHNDAAALIQLFGPEGKDILESGDPVQDIQREVGFGTILTVGYVGSAGVHLLNNYEQNPPTPVIDANGIMHFATLVNGKIVGNPRLNPAVGPLPIKSAVGHSNFNSLQVGLNRRFRNNLQFQVSYTYSRSMDNDSNSNGLESSNSSNTEMNPFRLSQDRAPSDFNRTQSLRVSSVYALPFKGNALVSGWQISGIESAASGPPFTIITGFDQTGFLQNFAGRPNLVPGCAANGFEGLATQMVQPGMFFAECIRDIRQSRTEWGFR